MGKEKMEISNSISHDADMIKPSEQEVFVATPWKEGNAGVTKRHDYNSDFKMVYRVVNLLDKKNCLVKNTTQHLINTGGREATMGPPYDSPAPAPAFGVQSVKASDFSNLPSVVAARKDAYSLNIAFDSEYQYNKNVNRTRTILSYQFATYLDSSRILEVCFISQKLKPNNRIYLRTCIGAILDLMRYDFGIETNALRYEDTRRYKIDCNLKYFDGDDEGYHQTEFFRCESDAKIRLASIEPISVLDKSNTIRRINDFKDAYKQAAPVTIVCHSGLVNICGQMGLRIHQFVHD